MPASTARTVEVDGRRLRVSNLDKVLYPETGTTKADVMDYYTAIAPALIPYSRNRALTRKRWPNGVGTDAHPIEAFFEKDLGAGVPDWVQRLPILHSSGPKIYPLVNDRPTLAWLAQAAALELHVPQWQFTSDGGVGNPDRIVLDFDPGPGIDLLTTAQVAFIAKNILDGMGLTPLPVTSGSKGIHVYAALDGTLTSDQASRVAHELARALEADHRDLIVSDMKKSLREGKVLIDWSQNNGKKTTIAPYSLRGRTHPTVAAPRSWDELADPQLRHLTYPEVLDRYHEHGDLLAPLLGVQPTEPTGSGRRESVTLRTDSEPPAAPAVNDDTDGDQVSEGMRGPLDLMLARAAERLPSASALPGGTRWEPKWDGFRLAAVVDSQVRLWSRQKKDLTTSFPDLAAATADQIPTGCVLDGEAVRWADDRLDFDALQRRLTSSPRSIRRLVDEEPATYVVFDLLAVAGRDLREHPYWVRRQLLEELAKDWEPPLSLSPATSDRATAQRWMRELAPSGVEGVVAKGADQPYAGGRRDWIKVKHRDTFELVAGAITGTLSQPGELILGRYINGELHIVGRSTPIKAGAVAALRRHLRPPEGEHPWPTVIHSTAYDRFNKKHDTEVTLIQPITVEVSADTSLAGDSLRHPARYVRTRPELDPANITGERP